MNEEQGSANDKRAKENAVRSFITSSEKTELPTQLSPTMYSTRQIPERKNDLTETDSDSESDSDEERDSEITPGTENTEYTGLTDYCDKGPKIDPYSDISHTNTQTKPRTDGNLCIHFVLDCGCEVMACQFSIEGSLLALGLIDGSIKVYSTDSFTLVHTLRDRDSIISSLPVTALQFFSSSQSYSLLLATYASGSMKCWYVWGGECLWMVREGSVIGSEEAGEGQRQTLSLSVSPLGDKAVTGGSDSAIHLYDLHTQQRLLTCSASSSKTLMDGHRFRVFALTFHPEIEKEFISGGWDNTIQFWDTRQQHAVRMLSGPHVCGDSLHVDTFHNQILSGSWRKDKALEIWDYNSGKKIIEVPNDPQGPSKIYSSHWLGQDKIVAAGSQSNMLRVIDRRTLMSVSKLYGLLSAVFSSCVCPGGKWVGLIAATSGNRVFLLDASSRQSMKQDHVYSPFMEELTYAEATEIAGSALCRFPLKKVRGVPLMEPIVQNWESIWAFHPDPSDILIATYPKAGTTWTQEIVDLLFHRGDAEACKRAPTIIRIPFLEICSPPPVPSGLDLIKKMSPPRVIKTHLPFQLVPEGFWENKCKTIYVARNAKDNLVSYYHFDRMNLTQPEPGPWDGYIHKFMRGELAWGSWYEHVKGYWKEREMRNILYLFYEDMKENPRREVERIMHYLDLSLPDDVIDRIVELTSFKVMKENPMANYTFLPNHVFDQSICPFMRKGEVGDWANHFSPMQSKLFDEDYERQMKTSNIPFRSSI